MQRSTLSPLMFIMVMELVSMKDILRKQMYAHDVVRVAESEQDVLEEWKEAFEKHGL